MNISLNPISLSGAISSSAGNVLGQLKNHVVKSLENLSYYIRYNQWTLAASVLGINIALIRLTDKLISVVSTRFELETYQESRVGQSVNWIVKGVTVLAGVMAFNRLLNLQLTCTYMAASVIATLALQFFWQKVVTPALKDYVDQRAAEKQAEENKKKVEATKEEVKKPLVEKEEVKKSLLEKEEVKKTLLEKEKTVEPKKEEIIQSQPLEKKETVEVKKEELIVQTPSGIEKKETLEVTKEIETIQPLGKKEDETITPVGNPASGSAQAADSQPSEADEDFIALPEDLTLSRDLLESKTLDSKLDGLNKLNS